MPKVKRVLRSWRTKCRRRLLQQVIPTEDMGEVLEMPDKRSTKYINRPSFSIPLMTNNFRRFNARCSPFERSNGFMLTTLVELEWYLCSKVASYAYYPGKKPPIPSPSSRFVRSSVWTHTCWPFFRLQVPCYRSWSLRSSFVIRLHHQPSLRRHFTQSMVPPWPLLEPSNQPLRCPKTFFGTCATCRIVWMILACFMMLY